jgi:hypothetical protein
MTKGMGRFAVFFGAVALAGGAGAQVPPPASCQALQTCVDNGVGAAVTTCVTQNPTCDASNSDKFALAAGVLAERAIAIVGCNTQTFPSKVACLRCYRRARLPLKLRLDLRLFHGLLGHAAQLVTAQGVAQCGALP